MTVNGQCVYCETGICNWCGTCVCGGCECEIADKD
jgi:hypothetical protein